MDNVNIKSGIILKNEIWTGNIFISDDIIIPKGVSVYVKPNTNIKFQKKTKSKLFKKKYKLNYLIQKFNLHKEPYMDRISIIVYGSFIVIGNEKERINIGNCGWNGIIYSAQSSILKLKYCNIRYGFGIFCDIKSKLPIIDSCLIEQCCLGIISFSKIVIKNSRISYNEIGIICYNKFFILLNEIYDNIKGIEIISKKMGLLYKNIVSLNNIGVETFKSFNIKLVIAKCELNNIGVSIKQSNTIFLREIYSAHNLLNVYVYDCSYYINIIDCLFLHFIGVFVDDLSEINVQNSLFFSLDYAIFSGAFTSVISENINISNCSIGFFLSTCNFFLLEKSNIDVFKRFLIAYGDIIFLSIESKYNSNNNGFLVLGRNVILYFEKADILIKDSAGFVVGNSETYFVRSKLKSGNFFDIVNKTVFNIKESFLEAKQNGFFLSDFSELNAMDSVISLEDGFVFNLNLKSKISIDNSKILSSKGSFSRLSEKTSARINKSKIYVYNLLCEISGFSNFIMENSSFKNKNDKFLLSNDFSYAYINNVKVKAFKGLYSFGNSNIILKNSLIFILQDFICTNENSQILIENNNIKLFDSYIKSFFSSEIYLDSTLFVKNIIIEIWDNSNLQFLKSNFKVINICCFHFNNLYKQIVSLENLHIDSKKLIIDAKENTEININNCQIKSKLELNIKNNVIIYNTMINDISLNINCLKVIMLKTMIQNSFLNNYDGEIEICDSKLVGEIKAIGIGSIGIIGSELEGEIEGRDVSEIEIRGSKIGVTHIVVGKGSEIRVEGSNIEVEEGIGIEGCGYIEGSEIKGEGGISKKEGEIIKIEGSKINSEIHIEKGKVEIEGSEVKGEKCGIKLGRQGDMEIRDSKVEGETGIEIGEESEIEIGEGVEIKGEEVGIKVEGGRDIRLSGIKIGSKGNVIDGGKGRIEVEGSELEGGIEAKGIGSIGIIGSELEGGIEGRDVSEIEIRGSKIKGETVKVSIESGIVVEKSKIKINKDIKIEGRATIEDCNIYSTNGIIKNGLDDFICNNVKIKSEECCLNVFGKRNVFCTDITLSSKINYSFVATNNTDVKFNNLEIVSNSGFLCDNVSVNITNLKANIFFKFLDINNTEFSIVNSKIIYKIPKSFISLNNLSNLVLIDTEIDFDNNNIYLQYFKDCSFITLKQNSSLQINKFKSKINIHNNCLFLQSKGNSVFNIFNSSIMNFYSFVNMNMLSCGIIEDSNINTRFSIAYINQYAKLISLNTTFVNSHDYKFVLKDTSEFYLRDSKILQNKFLMMNFYSQIYMYKNYLTLSGEVCRLKFFSKFEDYSSSFLINDDSCKRYAFYLQNSTRLILNSTEIKTNKNLFSIMDKAELNVRNSNIMADNKGILMFVRNKVLVKILNSNINTFSFAKLKNYANMVIEKTQIYTKNYGLKMLGNSKTFIKNSLFKNKAFSKKDTAFEVYNNSVLKLINSSVVSFKTGLKYDNNENIVIDNSKIDCDDNILFTNDKRYISVKNPIKRKWLYNLQQFVLSTNNIFLLNKFYNFIYSVSIYIYSFYINKTYLLGLYLRRGMLKNFIAGSSDIDFLTILKHSNVIYEYHCIFEIKQSYKKLKKIFPFYGENLIMNEKELIFYLRYGGIRSKRLKDSKLLYGKEKIKQEKREKKCLMNKIDVCSEILNSYILLNNNFFYNVDVVSDICFAKAAVDILNNIGCFYRDTEPLSRLEFLKEKIKKYDKNIAIFECLYATLKYIKRIDKKNRVLIFEYVVKILEDLSINFNNEMILNKYVEKSKISSVYKISRYREIKVLEEYIDMIILDSPGLCYVVLKNFIDINKIFLIYTKIKEKHDVYNTPMLFFTKNIFQMLICSNFKNNPLEYYKISNIEEKYKNRKIYLNSDYECFYNKEEILKQIVLTAFSQSFIQINEIDITENFQDIKYDLFINLLRNLQFYLYLKNGKIIRNIPYSDIFDTYVNISNNIKEIQEIMLLFENTNDLSDEIKINRIIVFIKKLQRELMKDYE